ncbi:hypothetical protein X777_12787 [Ooceraea biroi]|uniref:Odorant receptor n=1 Tax=Ooceraea biroi TaxID=2015173 RepID=A0A026VZH2_OOCBI|nr:hypothetical protein X777_12787 [Ooceraea biroi]
MCVKARTRVTCIDTQFLYICRLSLVAIGLWPYLLLFSNTTFLTTECTIDFIVEILSTSLFFLLCAIQYTSFWINTHVKRLFENLLYIGSELKDENKIAIIKRYGHIAKCAAIVFTLLTICILIIFILLPFLPRIFGIFFLVNKSELYHNVYITKYFIDEEKYFYFIFLHLCSTHYITGGTLLVAGIIVAGGPIYVCGFFNISSYRIEQAIRRNSNKVTNWKTKREIDKKIGHAVDIHRKALEFSEFFQQNFEGTYFLLIMLIVICLSLHLFGICQAVRLYRMQAFLLHCAFTVSILICSLGANYIGQVVTDHYNYIFSTAYNIRWYIAPVRVQRLILFLLQRGVKPYSVKFGGLYILCLETFATLSTASISYFTVIYSI